MNEEALKIFSADLAKELKAKLQGQETADFIDKVKASGDDRTFEVVMSTADEDRQGDSLDQSTWDFKYYDLNPVVLWAHNYSSFPIGIITDIEIQGEKTVATGKFAPEGVNPDADMACALYQLKILRAVSPGYIQNDDGTRELLEMSFCPVPAGRNALSMRQVHTLGLSTRELITKGFFFEAKAEEIGGHCELDDGTLGILADDPENPGHLICVPNEEGKAQEENKATTENMNDELNKSLKTETKRHGEAIVKSIDDFTEKSFDKDGNTGNDTTKEIDEFEKSIDGEHAEHLDKCMKAIDDNYELEDQKKAIDEFKSAMQGEHMKHVKCFDKAIDEFKSDWADGDDSDRKKAIDDFTMKSAAELGRHENAQQDLVKAEMGEGESDEEKAAAEAIQKAGASISAKNKEKLNAVIKALEAHHEEHGKSTNDVIASLKELMGSPQEDEGEEKKSEEASAPKPRSSPPVATESKSDEPLTEFETYMLTRKLLKAVYQTAGEGLTKISKDLREKYPSRR
jgi:hypothetical protein